MFTNLIKKKKLIDKELELYKQRGILDIQKTLEDLRMKCREEVDVLRAQCLNDMKNHEHDFHSELERKGVILAKLEAEIKFNEQFLEKQEEVRLADQILIDSLLQEISNLRKVVDNLIEKL